MRFILLGINFTILMLLAIYLVNLLDVQSYGTNVFLFLFISSVIALFIINELIEKYKISNPPLLSLPAVTALFVSIVVERTVVSFILSLMLSVPVIVLIIHYFLKGSLGMAKVEKI